MRFSTTSTVALAAALPFALAQTSTKCDPTKKTCPDDTGLPEKSFTSDFMSSGGNKSWTAAAYSTVSYGSNGAEFSISGPKQAPTMETDFYIFFGRVDVKMRAAKGTGIVSSIVFESDDLDEIDWEFLGGDTANVQTNFFGKGNTTSYDRMQQFAVSDPQDDVHTYSVDWTSERIEWIIDGTTVRTLTYDDPLCVGGQNYPQTPMRVKLGNWCGGCEGVAEGTVQWAGGRTTFADAPYVMYVESVDIQNYNPGDKYEWTDNTGSWQSIKVIKDGSAVQPSGGSGSGSGSADTTVASTATVAPTSSHPVNSVKTSGIAGKAYNTSMPHATGTGAGGVPTSIVQSTTRVPGSQPSSGGAGSGGSGGSGATPSGITPSTGGAASTGAMISTVLLGALFSILLL